MKVVVKLVIGKYSDVVVIFSSWVATSQLTIDPDTNKLYCGNCFQINSGNASDIDNEINTTDKNIMLDYNDMLSCMW